MSNDDWQPLTVNLNNNNYNKQSDHGQQQSQEQEYSYSYSNLQVNTPTSPDSKSYSRNSYHANIDSGFHSPSHSAATTGLHTPSASTSKVRKYRKGRKKKATEIKFANEFYKKAKVKKIMKSHTIIYQYEATVMLANFRNVEINQIDKSDMALKYLEGASVKHLKRILRELNATIRRTFYYGSDYQARHEQNLLNQLLEKEKLKKEEKEQKENSQLNNQQKLVLLPIKESNNDTLKPYMTLKDLSGANTSISSIDDYLRNTSASDQMTPSNDTITNNEYNHETFPSSHSINMDDNIDNTFELKINNNNVINNTFESFQMTQSKSCEVKPPIAKIKKYKTYHGKKLFKAKSAEPQPQFQTASAGNLQRRESKKTKMFGKYFDKRGSNISHNSIWSEGSSDYNPSDNDDDDDEFVLTKMESDDDNDDNNNNDNTIASFNDNPSDGSNYLGVPCKGGKPSKGGKDHIAQFSFASTISLGSEYMSDDDDFDINNNNKVKKNINTKKQRKFTNDFNDNNNQRRKLKLLKVDSAFLPDPNNNLLHHEPTFSIDSFLSDIDVPEPTAEEKLKYHLTEPRLPPSRRATYNYSHNVDLNVNGKKLKIRKWLK